MKLYRFTAPNTQRAIFLVHDTLGPDALVYSTRKIPDGIEVLAGHPFGYENAHEATDFPTAQTVTIEKQVIDAKNHQPHPHSRANSSSHSRPHSQSLDNTILEGMKIQMQMMSENILKLTNYVSTIHQLMTETFLKKKARWGFLKSFGKKKIKEGAYDSSNKPN